tara:strand:+ start:580 stop:696 length:117 start_codon:yes stop_codon:yes gene_type:complete
MRGFIAKDHNSKRRGIITLLWLRKYPFCSSSEIEVRLD